MTSKAYKPGPRQAYIPAPDAPTKADPRYDNPILNERETTHGDYIKTSSFAQQVKMLMRETQGWRMLTCDQQESLDMNATKVARILSGNSCEPDHWDDIAGYANLVSANLRRR